MKKNNFVDVYELLLGHYGPQNWWPAETPIEMAVGAILTQNTSWSNVEKAIDNLKKHNLLSVESLHEMHHDELALLIKSAGYYNVKAKRLKNLIKVIAEEYEGNIGRLFDLELWACRETLLKIKGVGEETADSILLYGGDFPVFVVDSYTHRVFSRHNLVAEECSYGEIQESFMENLPEDSALFNEYHALIVRVAKEYCKKNNPECERCPLHGV